MLTADTITDEQIRELQASTTDRRVLADCAEALWDEYIQSKAITEARARCAEILNARNKERTK